MWQLTGALCHQGLLRSGRDRAQGELGGADDQLRGGHGQALPHPKHLQHFRYSDIY